jgi:hypothetical protein
MARYCGLSRNIAEYQVILLNIGHIALTILRLFRAVADYRTALRIIARYQNLRHNFIIARVGFNSACSNDIANF